MNDNTILNYELKALESSRDKINKEIESKENERGKLSRRIGDLKKEAKGRYNLELENSQTIYEILNKDIDNYTEALKAPYFARIDFREYKREEETFYIGKFGIISSVDGEQIVVDWRAPIADLYYSGTQGEAYYKSPIGIIEGKLNLKRKFIYEDETIVKCFDEGINEIILQNENENVLVDEFLRINLEKNGGSKLKEVVATIQREQNEIIRAPKNYPIILQGSAGSGKTTIALHRLAYLIYRYKDTIKGSDILVIAPNKIFLDYISDILPELGVNEVKQKTLEELCKNMLKVKSKIVTKDEKLKNILEAKEDSSMVKRESHLKGSLFFKDVLDRYVKILEFKDSDIDDIKLHGYILFDKKEIKKLYLKDMTNYNINKRKDEIKRYLGLKLGDNVLKILDKVEFQYAYKISRIKKEMPEDSIERRKKLIEVYGERDEFKKQIKDDAKKVVDEYFSQWKGIDTRNLYKELFKDDELFEMATGGKIPEDLSLYTRKNTINNIENDILHEEDLVAMLYLKLRIDEIKDSEKYKHIVIDEAQDYSPLSMATVSLLALGNSMTIVGDVGQGIYFYKGIESWEEFTEGVFNKECNYSSLSQSYRSTVEIIDVANKVLEKQKNSLKPAKAVLRHGEVPRIEEFKTDKEFVAKIDEIVKKINSLNKKGIAIIVKNIEEGKKLRTAINKISNYKWTLVKENDKSLNLENIIIPSYLTKGLEFDCSIIYNCSKDNYGDSELDKKLLYVALTRALHYEYIFYKGEKSPLLD